VLALATTSSMAEGRARGGSVVRTWRFGDGELEVLLALGRTRENGGGRATAGDLRAPREAAFLARRWPTSGESGEGSLLGCGIYQRAPWGKNDAINHRSGVATSVYYSISCRVRVNRRKD
jgi:hypothetical protein